MKFCQNHWSALKLAITKRGLGDFVSADGREAIQREISHMQGEPTTKENFDPLMGAHWMIANRAMQTLSAIGANPLALMAENPEHPEYECPICYLNILSAEHDRTCTEPNCNKPKGLTFDDWIDSVADHIKGEVERL